MPNSVMQSSKIQLTLITFSLLFLLYFGLNLPSQYQDALSFENEVNLSTKFLNYYDPYEMIKIQYPSFWTIMTQSNSNEISFQSPITNTGVIIQNKPSINESLDEITMNMISSIQTKFPNVQILNTDLSEDSSNLATQTLLFRYGEENNSYKILLFIKIYDDRTIVFTYYSEENLFDRFFPLASHMYSSLQMPSFVNIFEPVRDLENLNQSHHLNDSQGNKSQTQQANKTILSNYENQKLSLSLKYPANLKKIEANDGLIFSSKDDGIAITASRIPLSNSSYNDFVVDHMISLNQTLHNFSVINSTTTNLLGYPTPMILFTYENGTQYFKGLQLWKFVDNSLFVYTYFANSYEKFDAFMPQIITMIQSIRLGE